VVVYAHDRRSGLGRQVARVTEWAAGQGLTVAGVVREVGSGVDGRRRGPPLRKKRPPDRETEVDRSGNGQRSVPRRRTPARGR